MKIRQGEHVRRVHAVQIRDADIRVNVRISFNRFRWQGDCRFTFVQLLRRVDSVHRDIFLLAGDAVDRDAYRPGVEDRHGDAVEERHNRGHDGDGFRRRGDVKRLIFGWIRIEDFRQCNGAVDFGRHDLILVRNKRRELFDIRRAHRPVIFMDDVELGDHDADLRRREGPFREERVKGDDIFGDSQDSDDNKDRDLFIFAELVI